MYFTDHNTTPDSMSNKAENFMEIDANTIEDNGQNSSNNEDNTSNC